ncbi:MAG: hypothetical protein U9P70_02625 [Patescibacteria group bacterium]|nr:hypothetical protein [Patescibacteria group bacterium]
MLEFKMFDSHIENTPNNLERKKDNWLKVLNESLELMSQNIIEKYPVTEKDLINKDGTLNQASFGLKREGGLYDTKTRKKHNKMTRNRERRWVERGEKSIEEYLLQSDKNFSKDEIDEILKKHSEENEIFWNSPDNQKAVDAILEQFNEDKQRTFGALWEKAKTVLCNELLGSDFIIVRAAKSDDYQNGIDNIIINKNNGNIVCAFDEISAKEESPLYEDKLDKVEFENKQGGVTIDYGITIKEGKIVKKQFNNIPILALRISLNKLINLLETISCTEENKKDENDKVKIDIFTELLNSLREQTDSLDEKNIMKDNENFISFHNSLDEMENTIKKNFPNAIEE